MFYSSLDLLRVHDLGCCGWIIRVCPLMLARGEVLAVVQRDRFLISGMVVADLRQINPVLWVHLK